MVSNSVNQYKPDFVTPPGESLQDTIDALGMTQTELAQRIGRHKKTVNEIIKGKQKITPETALQLEKALGVPASFWNNRQKRYDEYLARVAEVKSLEEQKGWLKNFPLKEMRRHRYIDSSNDPVETINMILSLLGVASPDAFNSRLEKMSVQYRKSSAFKVNEYALAAWLSKGREYAREVVCDQFDKACFEERLIDIRKLTTESPDIFVPEMREICSECGVKFVLVPELPKMPVYGATYWINDNPIIQLNIRGKKDDIFWFTFFHEAAHVLLHGRKTVIYLDVKSSEGEEEYQANNFAAEFLIPRVDLDRFVFSEEHLSNNSIRAFAARLGVSPGIVVGQMHHFKYAPYTHFQKLKRTFEWADN